MTAIKSFLGSKWIGPIAFVIGVILPFIDASNYSMNIMTNALIFILMASGLNMVVGYCGLLDLGYVAFMAVGAYTSGIIAQKFNVPLIYGVPAVIVATIIAGLLIGGPTLRLRSDYLAIVTLGFGEIIRLFANNVSFTGGPSGIFGIPDLKVAGIDLSDPAPFYFACLVFVSIMVVFSARLGKSRIGRQWRFVKEDEDAASAMGISTYKAKLLAYIFGAIWGGLAGVLFAAHQSAVSPQSFVFLQSALVLMAVVIGGMGSTKGVVLGGIIISLLPELLRGVEQWRYVIFGVLLIAVMILRPQGLWPSRAGEAQGERLKADKDEMLDLPGQRGMGA